MARSQESFSKKEKENNKAKKRKEKEARKAENKANSRGGGLDAMMAYVDEYGNIVDSPPDPNRKIEINEEDIEIGVPKRAEREADEPNTGRVTFFNDSKGYGFIKDSDNQESYFVHINACIDQIKENDKVTYDLEKGQKGWNAVNVKIAPKEVKTPPAPAAE